MKVIFNADDFGSSRTINAAVVRAHREGILTSASLTVTGDAAEEAVVLARENPKLAVGLHLVVPGDPVPAGLRYATSRMAREELAREIEAQFNLFAATGLPLSHVDGHMHLHLHPAVLHVTLPLARKHGACGFRLPRDDLWLSLRHDRRLAATKVAWAIALAWLSRNASRRLRRLFPPRVQPSPADPRPLAVPDRVYGVMESGRMTEAYVTRVIRHLAREAERHGRAPKAVELYFHPDTGPGAVRFGPNRGDLDALVSPVVRQVLWRAIEEHGLRPSTYAELEGE